MKICPKCNIEHNNKGLFCSRSHANSRNFSEESKKKKSAANKKFFSSLSDVERIKFAHSKIEKQDFIQTQNNATNVKRLQAWNKPYEDMSIGSLRKRLLHESNYKCNICNQGTEYNGKYLTLELDHIDGDNKNNTRENLRILCPNCHSQTPTFRARNIKSNKIFNLDKLTELLIKHKFASPALRELGFQNNENKMRIANEILTKLKLEGKV